MPGPLQLVPGLCAAGPFLVPLLPRQRELVAELRGTNKQDGTLAPLPKHCSASASPGVRSAILVQWHLVTEV